MARRKKKPQEDAGGPGDWLVTFSDCMTLLLCFFVLLLTFSSFDEVELQKLAGAFQVESEYDHIFPVPRKIKESMVPPPDRVVDVTEKGTETPTTLPPQPTAQPLRRMAVLEDEAYKDRKVLYIPSEWLFWGRGTVLTREGRKYLQAIASLLHMTRCRVVVGESGPGTGRPGEPDVRLDRAWAVVRFLTTNLGLPADRFNVTASSLPVPGRLKGHRVLAVTLISRDLY